MTVRELNREQYKELCQDYITRFWTDFEKETTSPYWGDLACADELVSEDIIYNHYVNLVIEVNQNYHKLKHKKNLKKNCMNYIMMNIS